MGLTGAGARQPAGAAGGRLSPRAAAGLVAASLLLAGCGGDDEPAGEPAQPAGATGGAATTASEPPPETAPGGDGADATVSGRKRSSDGSTVTEAATGAQPCPDVVITPNTGNGLFAVEAEGITCADATAALAAWGTAGYPGDSPPGFSCEELSTADNGSVRLSCEQEASGAVLEFDTGG